MDRLTAWAMRSAATVLLIAGMSVLVVGMAAGMLTGSPVAETIATILFQIGVAFVVAAAGALYLSRTVGMRLPNERVTIAEAGRPAIGGWLIALAITLCAAPVWLVIRLLPFLAEWRRVADFLATSGMLDGANANGTGLVLVPLFGALTPPLFELATMAGFAVASVTLVGLLLARSPRFPRFYIVSVLLLSALVIASVRGADAAAAARTAVEGLMQDAKPRAGEDLQVREGLDRYTGIVSSTASILLWTLCGYLIWVPALVFSHRARTTFAAGDRERGTTSARRTDVEAITTPPRFPG
jgi:hypothetical protein